MLKPLLLIFVCLCSQAFACKTSEQSKSSYIVDVNSWSRSKDSCIDYKILFQKRNLAEPNMFLVGARIEVKNAEKDVIYSSALDLYEAVEDMYITNFCINKEFIGTSNLTLWISYPPSIKLKERSAYEVGGVACNEEEVIKVSNLVGYEKKAK